MIDRRLIPSLLVLCLVSGLASASPISWTMDQRFGAVGPTGWPTVTFEDVSSDTVRITMDLAALSGGEKVTGWYFNTEYYLDPVDYTWSYVASSTGPESLKKVGNSVVSGIAVDPTWNTNDDDWRADGDGYYDVLLDFLTSQDTFDAGEKVIYDVSGTGLLASHFDVLGNPGPGADNPGPYRSVVRIQSTGPNNGGSDWIGDGDDFTPSETPVVPEPGTIVLLGGGLIGLGLLVRRRRE
jgi:hypothetical protein